VEDAFCEIVRALLPGEHVEINVCDAEMAERARRCLAGAGVPIADRVRFHLVPTDDAWIRDHGGVFVISGDAAGGAPVLLDFEFDAWGGKYPPWDRDAGVTREMARILGIPRLEPGIVLEGGAIEGDGCGTLLSTESCLLNPNRARAGIDRSREALERLLAQVLGVRVVLWLGEGIEGDDTDGHVDDLTRFVAPGRVVTAMASDPSDPNHGTLTTNRRRLESMRDAQGRRLEIVDLPMPGPLEGADTALPASYANFYFANEAVLLPVFGVDTDREAVAILERVVRDRAVVPIPSADLVRGLGAVHCLTQQEPAWHPA